MLFFLPAELDFKFDALGHGYGYSEFMLMSEIEDMEKDFLVEDTLQVHIQMREGGEGEKWSTGPQLLMQQLSSMLDDEELSDIQVFTPTKSFPASKIILAGNHNKKCIRNSMS